MKHMDQYVEELKKENFSNDKKYYQLFDNITMIEELFYYDQCDNNDNNERNKIVKII